ncbi:hypothetical protein FSP39_024199 [Pinctada imbricata]|uniref:Methyltransferase-like protein 5 n=1 Tax=Pinctada imbricata TaxID=66713 RepID=A0AA88YJL9_PINIB|nr:hypothetical protein FSP39_024199 [Pinctada imbricata]
MARKITKVKHLEMNLQEIKKFENPKNELEQYMTSPGQAAHTLMAIESQWGDIIERSVADLGCGTGMLSIGASILGADYVLGVEMDSEAMEICKYNIDNHDYDLSSIDLMAMDVVQLHQHLNFYKEKQSDKEVSEKQAVVSNLYKKFDTVIMNPPFGTKDESHGIDMIFLETAVAMATCAVYSFHLTSTTRYIKKKAKEINTKVEVVDDFDISLPKTYKFHTKKKDSTQVSLFRFEIR